MLTDVGVGGLTHRAIAARADVSLASLTYHFAGIDDLLGAAIEHADAQYREVLLGREWPNGVAGIAAVIAFEARERRELLVAAYEMYMLALRQPEHAATATAWIDELVGHFLPHLDPGRRAILHALVEGASMHAALQPDAWDTERIEALLRAGIE